VDQHTDPEQAAKPEPKPSRLARRLMAIIQAVPILARVQRRFAGSPLGRRLAVGVGWSLLGYGAGRIASAASTVLIARILGPERFGEYGMITSTVRTLAVFAGFRLGGTATKYVAEFREKDPARAAGILNLTMTIGALICAVVCVSLLIGAPYLAASSLNRPEITLALQIGAVLAFFMIYANVQQNALAGFENFREIAKNDAWRGLLTISLTVPCAWFFGLEGAVGGLAAAMACTCLLIWIRLRREKQRAGFAHSTSLRGNWEHVSVIWHYALPGVIIGLMITGAQWLGRVILANQPEGYLQLGLFEAANQWRAFILLMPATITRVALPMLSRAHGMEHKGEFRSAMALQSMTMALIATPLTILTIGFSGPIAALFGKGFAGTDEVIPLMMLSVFCFALNQSVRQAFDSAGRRWRNVGMYVGYGMVFVGCAYLFAPEFGAIGLAKAFLISEVVLLLTQALYVDLIFVPGAIRRNAWVFLLCFSLVAAAFFAHDYLATPWSFVVLGVLLVASVVPLAAKILGRGKRRRPKPVEESDAGLP
jgi:O-antigen/teichoic acid export membrane protein